MQHYNGSCCHRKRFSIDGWEQDVWTKETFFSLLCRFMSKEFSFSNSSSDQLECLKTSFNSMDCYSDSINCFYEDSWPHECFICCRALWTITAGNASSPSIKLTKTETATNIHSWTYICFQLWNWQFEQSRHKKLIAWRKRISAVLKRVFEKLWKEYLVRPSYIWNLATTGTYTFP